MKAEELFREVDEELQRDKLLALWKRWGGLATGAVLVLVVGVAGWQGWEWWQARQAAEAARGFAAAEAPLAQGRPAEAAAALRSFAGGAPAGVASVARLHAAAAALEAGDRETGLAVLGSLAEDGSADPMLRDLAVVLAASMEIDTAEPSAVIARLEPLAADGGAWRHLARELIAVAALRAGEQERAVKTLRSLADDAQSPPGVSQRSRELLRALGVEPDAASTRAAS